MTTEISFSTVRNALDSRLFFPGSQDVTLNSVTQGRDLGNGNYALGVVSYTFKGDAYNIEYSGRGFSTGPGINISGYAMSATLTKNDNVIGTMDVIFGASSSFGGAIISSAATMTPNSLVSSNIPSGGAHLNFIGSSGNDKFYGSKYGDYLTGGAGRDTLTGYGGNDEFEFTEFGLANADHIKDFAPGRDKIVFDSSLVRGVTEANLKNTFHDITTQSKQADDRLLYNHNTGSLFYDKDGSGSKAPVLIATLDNHATLTFRDFDVF